MDESFQKEIQQKALEATVQAMQDKISQLVCPIHQRSPRLQFSEDSAPGHQKMSFDCCCQTLSQMLQQALQN